MNRVFDGLFWFLEKALMALFMAIGVIFLVSVGMWILHGSLRPLFPVLDTVVAFMNTKLWIAIVYFIVFLVLVTTDLVKYRTRVPG